MPVLKPTALILWDIYSPFPCEDRSPALQSLSLARMCTSAMHPIVLSSCLLPTRQPLRVCTDTCGLLGRTFQETVLPLLRCRSKDPKPDATLWETVDTLLEGNAQVRA